MIGIFFLSLTSCTDSKESYSFSYRANSLFIPFMVDSKDTIVNIYKFNDENLSYEYFTKFKFPEHTRIKTSNLIYLIEYPNDILILDQENYTRKYIGYLLWEYQKTDVTYVLSFKNGEWDSNEIVKANKSGIIWLLLGSVILLIFLIIFEFFYSIYYYKKYSTSDGAIVMFILPCFVFIVGFIDRPFIGTEIPNWIAIFVLSIVVLIISALIGIIIVSIVESYFNKKIKKEKKNKT